MNKEKYNGFIRLEHDVVRSEAWAGLSGDATRLLIAILDRFNGYNNGRLHYGVTEAMKLLHSSRSSALRRFAELRKAEMIECTIPGSFANKEGARLGMSNAWHVPFLDRKTGG